jgi:hypothetical protein
VEEWREKKGEKVDFGAVRSTSIFEASYSRVEARRVRRESTKLERLCDQKEKEAIPPPATTVPSEIQQEGHQGDRVCGESTVKNGKSTPTEKQRETEDGGCRSERGWEREERQKRTNHDFSLRRGFAPPSNGPEAVWKEQARLAPLKRSVGLC